MGIADTDSTEVSAINYELPYRYPETRYLIRTPPRHNEAVSITCSLHLSEFQNRS